MVSISNYVPYKSIDAPIYINPNLIAVKKAVQTLRRAMIYNNDD